MDSMVAVVKASKLNATIKVIGKTHQGRPIKMVQVFNHPSKHHVYIQSGLIFSPFPPLMLQLISYIIKDTTQDMCITQACMPGST